MPIWRFDKKNMYVSHSEACDESVTPVETLNRGIQGEDTHLSHGSTVVIDRMFVL
jgi:hypothetical protein